MWLTVFHLGTLWEHPKDNFPVSFSFSSLNLCGKDLCIAISSVRQMNAYCVECVSDS